MKSYRLAVFVAIAAAGPSLAEEPGDLAALSFSTVDTHGNGYVSLGDVEAYRGLVFTSMDADGSHSIDRPEFMSWDYGFEHLAAEADRVNAYETSLKVVFAFWDRNGNGSLDPAEHRHAIIADFRRADINDDAVLSEDEFVHGFSILAAIRVALED